MVSHVLLSKVANSFSPSHCRVSLSIKSATFISCEDVFKKTGGWGSQEWDATEIFLPSPIVHLYPAWIISLAASKERHTKEGLVPSSASKKEVFGKYLALYTLKNSGPLLWIRRYACLVSIARLKAWRSLKPLPPSSLKCIVYANLSNGFFSPPYFDPTNI